jgi:hypothetical protein
MDSRERQSLHSRLSLGFELRSFSNFISEKIKVQNVGSAVRVTIHWDLRRTYELHPSRPTLFDYINQHLAYLRLAGLRPRVGRVPGAASGPCEAGK